MSEEKKMKEEKKDVNIDDLPEEELKKEDLDKVAGGCDGMSQDPQSVPRVKLNVKQ